MATLYMVAEIATAEAEWTRTIGTSDPNRWKDAIDAWDQFEFPYRAACARWRQAEALLGAGASRADVQTVASRGLASRQQAGRATANRRTGVPRPPRPDQTRQPADQHQSLNEQQPDAGAQLQLTTRERQVLALLADGRTNKQIAKTLYISEKTAGVHVSHILAKLGVTNRGEAAAVAHRLGLNAVT